MNWQAPAQPGHASDGAGAAKASTAPDMAFTGLAGALAADVWTGTEQYGPILLLHGGGQTRHSWRRGGRRFAQAGWTTIAVDARGHGDSSWAADGDYSLDGLVADLAAIMSKLDSEPVLIGASMGGITALVGLGEGTITARGLVLVDVAPRLETAGVQRIIDFMSAAPDGFASLAEVADAISAYNPHRPRPSDLSGLRKNVREGADGRWYWHWDPKFLDIGDETARSVRSERLKTAASGVRVPTMLVRGEHSDVVSVEGATELNRLIPHAVVKHAPAGHMVAGDDNDVFASQVIDFLASLNGHSD